MSAYKRIECQFKNKELLIESLEKLGFHPESYEEAVKLRGYTGDYRTEKAHIVIPKEQINKLYTAASNDLGFYLNSENETYLMIVSEYDEKCGIGDKVQQSYARTAMEAALTKNKFTITKSEASIVDKNKKLITIHANKIV